MNVILLSGGSGKRLWPLSNDVRSKQFIKLFKNNDEYESMVQRVYRQITTVDADAKITIATSKSQASAIKNQLGEKASICVEPCRRDTFPAIALAAAYLHDELGVAENEAVVVCPVDPYVDNTYYEAVKNLQELAEQGGANLTLMGIEPTYPSEKYGYIIPESGENVSKVKEFKEKPDVETAKKYLAQSALWNAGIFAFKLGYLLDKAHSMIDFEDYRDLFNKYETMTKISFDYAVVEKESSIQVLRYSGDWKDVGTWNMMAEVMADKTKGKAVLDGSSWNIAKSVFDALGADTYVINNKPNGLNINNNAGSTHIEGLQKFVVEKGLDVGFAYDGDADRCLCVDEKGNVVTGDHILYIYGCYMKERGKLLTNTVVTTVMSNFGLYKAFDEKGISYAKTAVGDKYVYEYMAKNGCRIGGEQSGHIIFSKYASTGDGILTSLKMMEVMLAKKKPMSELAAPLKIYPQVLENVRVTDKKAAQNDEAVQAAVKKVSEELGDTGRILVRESGTEPVVRVMVEAPDHDTCQKYVSEVVDVIRDRGYSL